MNSQELLIEIDKRLKDSGIVTLIQDFARSNPNYWTKTKNSDDIICTCGISVSCIARPDSYGMSIPFMSLDIGSFDTEIAMLWDHTLDGGSFMTEVKKHD